MSIIYQILRLFLQFCVNVFYAKVGVRGLDNIPRGKTAVVFTGNHFNGLVDPAMVFSCVSTREITMVAADYLWQYPVIGWLLRGLGAIPVTNKWSAQFMKNKTVQVPTTGRGQGAVSAIAEVLKRRSCICIFPEGTSHSKSELQEFKTGFARAAFQALQEDDTLEEVYVVPVGLNYDSRNRFRSNCYVEFGIPVVLTRSEWLPRHEKDPQGTVRQVVERVRRGITELTLVAPSPEHLKLAHLTRKLYREPGAKESQEEFVRFTKYFIRLLARKDSGDEDIARLYSDLRAFQSNLDVLGISLDELMHRDILYIQALITALVAPLAIPGGLFHGPPAFLARIIARRMSEGLVDQEAHYKVLVLIFLLPVYYVVSMLVLWIMFGLGNALMIMAGLVMSVHFAMRSRPFSFTARFFTNMLKLVLFDQERMRQQCTDLSNRVQECVKLHMENDIRRRSNSTERPNNYGTENREHGFSSGGDSSGSSSSSSSDSDHDDHELIRRKMRPSSFFGKIPQDE